MKHLTTRQRRILALVMPFGLTVVGVNIGSVLGASEATKDNIVLLGTVAFLVGLGWAIWTLVRKSGG